VLPDAGISCVEFRTAYNPVKVDPASRYNSHLLLVDDHSISISYPLIVIPSYLGLPLTKLVG
jgi:hypothetical protein